MDTNAASGSDITDDVGHELSAPDSDGEQPTLGDVAVEGEGGEKEGEEEEEEVEKATPKKQKSKRKHKTHLSLGKKKKRVDDVYSSESSSSQSSSDLSTTSSPVKSGKKTHPVSKAAVPAPASPTPDSTTR